MARIRADHENHAATTHDLAMLANSLYACSNLHRSLSSLGAESDAPRRPPQARCTSTLPAFSPLTDSHPLKRRHTLAAFPGEKTHQPRCRTLQYKALSPCAARGGSPPFHRSIQFVSNFRPYRPVSQKMVRLAKPMGPNTNPLAGRLLRSNSNSPSQTTRLPPRFGGNHVNGTCEAQ